MQGMSVVEEPFCAAEATGGDLQQSFTVHLLFHPLPDYPSSTKLTWRELADTVDGAFTKETTKAILKQFRCALARARA